MALRKRVKGCVVAQFGLCNRVGEVGLGSVQIRYVWMWQRASLAASKQPISSLPFFGWA